MTSEQALSLKVVTLEPTPFCNQSCQTCNTWLLTRNPQFVAFHREQTQYPFLDVVEQAWQMGVEHINLAGGEPFAYKGVMDLIISIKGREIGCSLVTNGTLINAEIARQLIDSHIDAIRFSVDGSDEEVHDRLRGQRGAFMKVIGAIREINHYGEEQGYIPHMSFNTTISPLNFPQIPLMVCLAAENGIKRINYGLAIQTRQDDIEATNQALGRVNVTSVQFLRQNEKLLFTEEKVEQLRSLFDEAEQLAGGIGIQNNIYVMKQYLTHPETILSGRYLAPLIDGGEVNCVYPFQRTLVDAYGNVYPCSPIREVVGNLTKASLKDIWTGEAYRKFRIKFREMGHFPICLSCCNLNRMGGTLK